MPDPMIPTPASGSPMGVPPTFTAPTGDVPLPPTAALAFWRGEVERSQTQRKTLEPSWQENLDYYTGKPISDAPPDYINVNVDFYQVEQKMAQLFYETPELQLTSTIVSTGQDSALHTHRALLNEQLGAEYADVLTTVLKAIKDCLCPSGIGPTIIGYQPTNVEVPNDDPTQPPTRVPIHERWYWTRFSPKKLLIPADFKDTDWDQAPWLGMDFRMPITVARRDFQLPPTFAGSSAKDDKTFEQTASAEENSSLSYVEGQLIWYKASVFDEAVAHPDLYRELVLIDGLDHPARHRNSPYQTVGPDGLLTADSMIGNPIHPLTIRDVPDSAYTPSDSQMTRPLVKELCTFRTQMKRERDANRSRVLYDASKLPPEVIDKIARGTLGDLIPVEEGVLAQGVNAIMAQVITGTGSRQTYEQNNFFQRDIAKTLGLDASAVGAKEDTQRSATEINTIDRATSVRLDAERRQVLRWYLKGVNKKFSPLLVRFMKASPLLPKILGVKAQAWTQAEQQGLFSWLGFSAKADSQIRLDASAERKFKLQVYQMVARDPNVIRVKLLEDLLASCGYDPAETVTEKLPEKTPEPNVSFRFSGEDLYNPMVQEILAQGGIKISPEAIQQANKELMIQTALGLRDVSGKPVPYTPRPQEHGGPTEPVRPLTKEQGDETPRGMPGAPMGMQQ